MIGRIPLITITQLQALLAAGVQVKVVQDNNPPELERPPLPVIQDKQADYEYERRESRRMDRQEWRRRNRDFNRQMRSRGRG